MTEALQTGLPLAVGSNDGLGVLPKRTEWAEVRIALRKEYGRPYIYNGVPCMDFSRHVYVGRAGALLLKAERHEELLRRALDALEHHREQTRPIERTDGAIADIRRGLGLETPNR